MIDMRWQSTLLFVPSHCYGGAPRQSKYLTLHSILWKNYIDYIEKGKDASSEQREKENYEPAVL